MSGIRVLRSPRERIAVRWSPRAIGVQLVVCAIALAVSVVAVYTGALAIAPAEVTRILLGDYSGADAFEIYTILDIRVPRAVCAMLVGAALGASGAIFQRLTDNPLGSPDLIGFSSGAAAGALLAISAGTAVAFGALGGGAVAVVAVAALAWRRGLEGQRMLVVGIAVGAVLSAVSSYLLSRMDIDDAATGYRWLVGGLVGVGWDEATFAVVGLLVVAPFALWLHRGLDRLSVGPELAQTQGLAVGRVRILAAVVGTALITIAVCVAGPIGFVALAAPHVSRMVTARAGAQAGGAAIGGAALVGAALLAVADVVALRLFPPHQLPTGVVTAVVGGVYLVWLLQRRARGGAR